MDAVNYENEEGEPEGDRVASRPFQRSSVATEAREQRHGWFRRRVVWRAMFVKTGHKFVPYNGKRRNSRYETPFPTTKKPLDVRLSLVSLGRERND